MEVDIHFPFSAFITVLGYFVAKYPCLGVKETLVIPKTVIDSKSLLFSPPENRFCPANHGFPPLR
jgi:hypothetical protein